MIFVVVVDQLDFGGELSQRIDLVFIKLNTKCTHKYLNHLRIYFGFHYIFGTILVNFNYLTDTQFNLLKSRPVEFFYNFLITYLALLVEYIYIALEAKENNDEFI